MSRTHTIAEIAGALCITKQAVAKRADKEKWPFDEEPHPGKPKRLYRFPDLPKAVREALDNVVYQKAYGVTANTGKTASTATAESGEAKTTAIVPATTNLPAKKKRKLATPPRKVKAESELTDANRAYRDAALILCLAIEEGMAIADSSEKSAIVAIAGKIIGGTARPELIEAADATYLKKRQTGQTVDALTSRLQKMMRFYRDGRKAGDAGMYLVAKNREPEGYDPIHILAFLIHFCRPNCPPVMEAWRNSEAWFIEKGIPRPADDTFYRIEKSLPVTIKYRGRMTGGQWRSLLTYVKRDVSMFSSNDIWVGDGHSFKAKVQHPIHGRPFTPEVTLIIDWVSHRIVGWSVDLAESTIAVSAAFRHAQIQTRARPLVYYSDNGGGQTGKHIDCAIHGTLARQAIAHETGIPGNPQGRGIIERIWPVTLIPLARTYPTCTWKGADKENTRKMLVALNKKDGEGEKFLPSWKQFLIDIEQCVQKYNATHSHSSLNGNTPDAEYQARLDPNSVCYGPTDAEIDVQWMPEEARTPQRGVVTLFNNEYFNKDLIHQIKEGEKVRVRFDIHNADRVWLLRMDGRFLGTAEWDGHKRAAFPVPFIEQKREERAAGKIKRGERIIEEANAELGNVIEGDFASVKTVADVIDFNVVTAKPEPLKSPVGLLPETEEKPKESTYAETIMLLEPYWEKKDDEGEVAFGS